MLDLGRDGLNLRALARVGQRDERRIVAVPDGVLAEGEKEREGERRERTRERRNPAEEAEERRQ
jgi:hypothetical protein